MTSTRPFNPLRQGCLPPAAPVTPAQALEILASRKASTNVYRFPHKSPSKENVVGMADVTPGPPSIVELARALNLTAGDLGPVDLMYEFVAENIDFIPTWGLHKGGLGALIDGCGNAFDQCDLMGQLLTATGYSFEYCIGQVNLDPDQWSNWLGVTLSGSMFDDTVLALQLLYNGGIGASANDEYVITMNHCWLSVSIEGPAYMFDPTFKTYNYTTGIDIATATGYSRSTFLSDATSGATVTTDYAQNINGSNINSDLNSYTTSLIDWINASSSPGPGATLDQIIGGREIQPVDGPVRQTSLPNQSGTPSYYPNWEDTGLICTIEVQYGPGSGTFYIDQTFNTNDIYSERMTIWFNDSNVASLYVNGAVVGLPSSTAQSSSVAWELNLIVTHPYPWTDPTLTANFGIVGGAQTTIGMALGVCNSQMAQYHQEQQNLTFSTGPSAGAEDMLGQSLLLIFDNYSGQCSLGLDITNRMGGCTTVVQQFLGAISQSTVSGENYVTTNMYFASNTSALSSSVDIPSVELTMGLLFQMLEGPACQQVTGVASYGITGLMQTCNTAGTKIYGATSSNWTTGTDVESIMSSAGYPSSALTSVGSLISEDWMVMMPDNGSITLGSLTGVYGYLGLSTSASTGGVGNSTSLMWLSGLPYKGGASTVSQTSAQTNGAAYTNATQVNAMNLPASTTKGAQVNVWNGRYEFSTQDISVGNQGHPYQLAFVRSYNSALRLTEQGLGFGWRHNWQNTAASNSDGFMMFGYQRPLAAVPAIVALYVCTDVVLSNEALPIGNMVICSIVQQFLAAQLVNNTVRMQFGAKFEVFTLLPNGNYLAPLGLSDLTSITLTDGVYTLTTPDQVVYTYYASGSIDTIAYPYGITLTFTYTGSGGSGSLSSVSNGFRALTFGYDEYGNLSSVTDGNGRYVYLTVSTSYIELVSVEDPMTYTTTYSYNDPSNKGQLYQVFKPANPSTAVLTNTYDSLGRIETQTDAYSNVSTYYMAGSRTQAVDPQGNASIQYYDAQGSVTRAINALGQETDFQYDGNERCLQVTFPEGNGLSMSYDQYGRLLTNTQVPTPSSTLSSRTVMYAYGGVSQWNNLSSITDPAGNVTSLSYVNSGTNGASRVYQITPPPPSTGATSPVTTFTYNSRGQLLTGTDPTSIVTTNTYGSSPYNLLSTSIGPSGLGITCQWTYDSVGNVATFTDANDNTSTMSVDSDRRITQITGPTPFSQTGYKTYDANSNVIKTQSLASTDANCQIYTATYTVDNLVSTMTGPVNNPDGSQPVPTVFLYDSLRRLSQITDPAGYVGAATYDAVSRPLTGSVNGATQWTALYTENGLLQSIADARSNTTQYQYDGFDRLVTTIYPDFSTEQVTDYDVLDNVLTATSRAGVTFTFTYDNLCRLLTASPGSDPELSYTYDLANRLLAATKAGVGDPSYGTYSLNYDGAGRFYQEETSDSKVITAMLDGNSNITQITYTDGTSTVTHSFDALNRLTSLSGLGGNVSINYNSASRRIAQYNGNGTAQGYWWDMCDNVLAMTFGGLVPNSSLGIGSRVDFAYSATNIAQQSAKQYSNTNLLWQPATMETTTYGTANSINQYPSVNGVDFTYDGNGCLTSDGTNTYSYNSQSQLTTVNSVTYSYDPFGRLTVESTSGTATARHVYFCAQRLEDWNGSSTVINSRYVYGSGTDECLYIANLSAETVSYLHKDETNSTVLITGASSVGTIECNAYTPWGELASGSLSSIPIGFTGQFYQPEAALYYYKARHYSPSLGRFLQPDPFGYDGGLNLYEYCGSDPVNNVDVGGTQLLTATVVQGAVVSPPLQSEISNQQLNSSIGGIYANLSGSPYGSGAGSNQTGSGSSGSGGGGGGATSSSSGGSSLVGWSTLAGAVFLAQANIAAAKAEKYSYVEQQLSTSVALNRTPLRSSRPIGFSGQGNMSYYGDGFVGGQVHSFDLEGSGTGSHLFAQSDWSVAERDTMELFPKSSRTFISGKTYQQSNLFPVFLTLTDMSNGNTIYNVLLNDTGPLKKDNGEWRILDASTSVYKALNGGDFSGPGTIRIKFTLQAGYVPGMGTAGGPAPGWWGASK